MIVGLIYIYDMKNLIRFIMATILWGGMADAQEGGLKGAMATTANGVVEGTIEVSGIRSFKGIPYAAPPVGALRFKAPQPALDWTGVRQTKAFGPRAMQLPVYSDMNFRSDGMSEDCLYLNVWTSATDAGA